MLSALRRFLCRIDRHAWTWWTPNLYPQGIVCVRCGKVKAYPRPPAIDNNPGCASIEARESRTGAAAGAKDG